MIKYIELGRGKRLNEIVMIGSHDAGITKGSSNVQTQSLDIGSQATAGVRIFDIRITGSIVDKGKDRAIGQLATYHGMGIKPGGIFGGKKTVVDLQSEQVGKMKIQKMGAGTGAYGETLSAILIQSRKFVMENASEFLLLKFDKCSNWQMIASACVDLLGDRIYTGGGNVNRKTLGELAGFVVVLFSGTGLEAIPPSFRTAGILGFKSLYDKDGTPGTYDATFAGLQYIGKGGTGATPNKAGFYRGFKGKMKENMKKQQKIMSQGGRVNQEVLGMMYWTTTGFSASIKNRNDFLWNDENQDKLVDLWESRIPNNVDPTHVSSANVLKRFMPNFVMVDFADATKCEKIFELNFLSAMHAHNAAVDHFANN